MALRERGRLKVIVAIGPDISTERVLVMVAAQVPVLAAVGFRAVTGDRLIDRC